ncbi:MAG TPA: fumarate hydratase, partial [Candidatus Cloacimonadota bacterium]|nr:fumarate hydratase [Candidatus Cloacimonadota bacterium]
MKEVDVNSVKQRVKEAFIDANYNLNKDVREALVDALQKETSPHGKEVLAALIENYQIAEQGTFPLCQDTGVAVIFCEIGQDIHFINGSLKEALNEAVREAYQSAFLRKSLVASPLFDRINTKDNTPAIIHYDIKPGSDLKISVMPKGGGSENMSTLVMLKPADGEQGLIDLVISHIKKIGGNPCPPIIVGIGIGGNFETCALLAKKALLTEIECKNEDPELASLEDKLKEEINQT